MENLCEKFTQATLPRLPKNKTMKIGCIGSGFIMAECQLSAYRKSGFCVSGIASRTYENAKKVAERYQIPNVYQAIEELIADSEIEIVDIALPPHVQKDIVRLCCEQDHIRGILCQKPLAVNMNDMKEISRMCKNAGIKVAVNQNMRYDQSIRALKYALEEGYLGDPVLASIDLRALAGVQPFFRAYGKFEILDLAIHHLDCFRYLFGDPEKVIAVCRPDPRTPFEHRDGLSEYILQYKNGLIANSIDDGYAGPDEPCASERYINWRVEGTGGIALGTIGWHRFPEITPSTFKLASTRIPDKWLTPSWKTAWFPDAFTGTMADLMCALEEDREPVISVEDNLVTMACVEACYKSIREERTVYLRELI